jgi:hypothetical protein
MAIAIGLQSSVFSLKTGFLAAFSPGFVYSGHEGGHLRTADSSPSPRQALDHVRWHDCLKAQQGSTRSKKQMSIGP